MKHIYLVEDEKRLSSLLKKYLQEAGYEVTVFDNGDAAKAVIGQLLDLWILDIMLPGTDGYELIRLIKENDPQVPVIFMSARSAELDRVIGLELGSDDYIAKPFLPRELVLRVNRLLKNTSKETMGKEPIDKAQSCIHLGSAIFDKNKRILIIDQEDYRLSTKEFDLLEYMIHHEEKALSRSEILDQVWGEDYFGSERVVDDTIRRLRKKVNDLPIETVYGYGYQLRKSL